MAYWGAPVADHQPIRADPISVTNEWNASPVGYQGAQGFQKLNYGPYPQGIGRQRNTMMRFWGALMSFSMSSSLYTAYLPHRVQYLRPGREPGGNATGAKQTSMGQNSQSIYIPSVFVPPANR